MTTIPPIVPTGPAQAPARGVSAGGGFRLPAIAEPAAPAPPEAAASLGGLLALQEVALPAGLPGARDRAARRHGAALLAALT
ncbi:MAG: hypothetical protein KGI51_16215, partial [Rhodospirillales bacterium]|nr:hypothetical protein [Rhodospirillales bacterium]